MDIFDHLESNVRSYCRLFPTVFSSAQGSILTDENGRTYIDFLSGGGALNYGHNDPAMQEAIIDYLRNNGLIHSLDMHTRAKADFLDTFEALILQPRDLEYKIQFTGPTGSNAIEAALKLARLVKKRSNIIAFTNSFHGLTLGALAVTGNSFFRNERFVDRHNVSFLPFDGYPDSRANTMSYLKKVIDDPGSGVDLPAAILLETIQAEGGINIASVDWLQELHSYCQDKDILLIVDEIQTGAGRTGPFFSFEEAGLYPDIVVLSKSLSGFGLPMSLLLLKPELDQWLPGEHTGTFRGNNLAFITATEALKKFWQEAPLSETVRHLEQIISDKLQTITENCPELALTSRGKGMLHGIQTTGEEQTLAIIRTCFEQGLLLESCGSGNKVLKLSPPLTIKEEQLNTGLSVLEESFYSTQGKSRG